MTFDFPLEIIKKRIAKRMRLRVDSDRKIAVLITPIHCQKEHMDAFVKANYEWIMHKLSEIKDKIIFKDGDKVSLLGKEYDIFLFENNGRYLRKEGNHINVYGRDDAVHKEILKVAKKDLEKYAWKKIKSLTSLIDVDVKNITVKKMKSRYGSCSSLHNININLLLAFAPLMVTDMVIAHEVAHLKYLNHGVEFKKTLSFLCPDYKNADLWLKQNALNLKRISFSL